MKNHYFCLLIWFAVTNMFLIIDSTANKDSTKGNNSINNNDDTIKSSNGNNVSKNNSDDIDKSIDSNNFNNNSIDSNNSTGGGNNSIAIKRSLQRGGVLLSNQCSHDSNPITCFLVYYFPLRLKEECNKTCSNDYERIKNSFKQKEYFIPPFWFPYCVKWHVSGREVRLCSLGYTKIK